MIWSPALGIIFRLFNKTEEFALLVQELYKKTTVLPLSWEAFRIIVQPAAIYRAMWQFGTLLG
jgi:hypothetical protein